MEKKEVKNNLNQLINLAKTTEEQITKGESKKEQTAVVVQEEQKPSVTEVEPLKEVTVKEVAKIDNTKSADSYVSFFKSNDYGVGELNVKIPTELHKQIKLLSTATNTPIVSIMANIVDDWLKTHEKEIKVSKKAFLS